MFEQFTLAQLREAASTMRNIHQIFGHENTQLFAIESEITRRTSDAGKRLQVAADALEQLADELKTAMQIENEGERTYRVHTISRQMRIIADNCRG